MKKLIIEPLEKNGLGGAVSDTEYTRIRTVELPLRQIQGTLLAEKLQLYYFSDSLTSWLPVRF